MKFKNVSKEVKSFKLDGKWIAVAPGKVFNSKVEIHDVGIIPWAKSSRNKSSKRNKPKNRVAKKKKDIKKKDEEIDMDLNNDGKVDEKDISIWGKIGGKIRKMRRKNK